MWIFGYGSLVFRPGFPFLERHPASIDGWARRWWQASPDHRGTPERPGRVVTLTPHEGRCAGMAYRVDGAVASEVVAALDRREIAGYEAHRLALRLPHTTVEDGLVYVAGPDNPSFLGPADPDVMASHIATSRGPSGENADYLLQLAEALRAMGAEDRETFDLERRVLSLLGRGSGRSC